MANNDIRPRLTTIASNIPEFAPEIPLHMSIRTTSDAGNPVVASEPDGPHAAIYRAIGTKVREQLQGAIAAA